MAGMNRRYKYPVTEVREAKIVIEPEFQPELFDEQHLYVNLDAIRNRAYLNDLYFDLGYNQDKQALDVSYDYVKIIFSGHRGCGKSAELKRIKNELNHPKCYFTIFIALEQEIEVGSFQYADFFSLLLHKLIEELEERVGKGASLRLQQLAEKLLCGKTEKMTVAKNKIASNSELDAEAGFKLFGMGGKATFKEVFASENEISTTIRREIKQNMLPLIYNLNAELADARMKIEENGLGQDILFIIDGSEKMPSEVYEDLFIKNSNVISELSVNMVAAVPISAYYLIEKAPHKFNSRYTVPMLNFDNGQQSVNLMREIVAKRIDTSIFLEENALKKCIEFSGGCIRQLFQLVHAALKKSQGKKIELQHVDKAIFELGKYLWEYLDNDHLKVLKDGEYRPANKKVGELLYILILLKYNGHIKINPLLNAYPDFIEWWKK